MTKHQEESLEQKSLLVFTIGPVQSYIAQVRKTQDLYVGSFILSHLCRIAAEQAIKKYNAKIIFPALDSNSQKKESLPNRFLAILPLLDNAQLQKVGEELERLVRYELLKLSDAGVSYASSQKTDCFDSQIINSLQINWVAKPFLGNEYSSCYRKVERWLGAVKSARVFNQTGETGRKCSVTGEHNALFYRDKPPANLSRKAVRLGNHVPLKYIKHGEYLGAVAFVKRYSGSYFKTLYDSYDDNFDSTARIALMESLQYLPIEFLREYETIIGDGFDAQDLYEENLSKERFNSIAISNDRYLLARKLLQKIHREAERVEVKLCRYYAVLVLDGDNMGRWLSGEYLVREDELLNFHMNLTDRLSKYADLVKEIINSPRGRLIYCGGDDVLALVNLNHLLPVLRELRQSFPSFAGLAQVNGEKDSSASCGVCIAHYKTPLPVVLEVARQMEREAKHIEGKDALALAAVKHSGEIHKTVFKWQFENVDGLSLLQELVGLLRGGQFSDTFIRKLQSEFHRLMSPDGNFSDYELFEKEIKRLLTRSCVDVSGWSDNEFKLLVERLAEQLISYSLSGSSLKNLLSYLDISIFLAREVN